ncbi:MAG: hypothetical protein M1352_01780 [Patescibacteria group bacterium]|nr:hypothetical protein [Patescibacteria group bacterium]
MAVSLIKCPVCGGSGCASCQGSGALGVDELGVEYYVTEDSSGNWQVAGRKEGSSGQRLSDRLFSYLERITSEPHDIIWAVKILRKNQYPVT